jgi:cytochrome b
VDLPTRLFHWLLVALVITSWVSWRYSEALGDHTLKIHRWNGQAILVLVVWRLLWGLIGSSTSRFSAGMPSDQDSIRSMWAFGMHPPFSMQDLMVWKPPPAIPPSRAVNK